MSFFEPSERFQIWLADIENYRISKLKPGEEFTVSTRSVVGEWTGQSHESWQGRYVHSDGYPTGVGQHLYREYKRVFEFKETPDDPKGVANLVERLMSERVGWSALVGYDLSLRPQWSDNYSIAGGPRSYTERGETPHNPGPDGDFIRSTDEKSWCEWAYIFDVRLMTMTVIMIGFQKPNRIVGTVDLTSDVEPDWDTMEAAGNE